MEIEKCWTWIKVISAIMGILIAIAIAVSCYFMYKESFMIEDETEKLDKIKDDYVQNMNKVIIFAAYCNIMFLKSDSLWGFYFLKVDEMIPFVEKMMLQEENINILLENIEYLVGIALRVKRRKIEFEKWKNIDCFTGLIGYECSLKKTKAAKDFALGAC